jgi:hypothetical protein
VIFQWTYKEELAIIGSDVLPRSKAQYSNVTKNKQQKEVKQK